jgi:hypothetical protein
MKNKDCWMIGINLNGLWDNKPIKGTWLGDLNSWYDESGNFNVDKIGLDERDGYLMFSSYNKKDVELFLLGAKSISKQIKNVIWTEDIFPRKPKDLKND